MSRILRFDGVQRAAHWANALLFGVLMVTALPFTSLRLSDVVGRRALVANIHVWSGIILPLPVLISLLGPWGAQMRRDLRRINVWTADEVRWLRSLGRNAPRVVDKFNPGQKLNAIFIGGSIMVMLATGFVLKWFRFFPVSWRTGATFVHDVLAFAIFVVVIGHILFALTHPESMRSMIKGWVTERGRPGTPPGWLKENKARVEPDGPADARSGSRPSPQGEAGRRVNRLSGPLRSQLPERPPDLCQRVRSSTDALGSTVMRVVTMVRAVKAEAVNASISTPVRSTISVTALISIRCTSTVTSTATRSSRMG